jgi:hypothetical protein
LTFRAEKYVKKLFGIRHVEDAFQRLDKLTQEEARMAEVEIMTIANRIDENVIRVGENVEGINEGLQGVHVVVQGVGHDIRSIHAGDLFFPSLASERVLSLTLLGVTETRKEMQVVLKYVSDLNR